MANSSLRTVLGIMSGSSLDGIDLALCSFDGTSDRWTFTINAAGTVPFPSFWKERLLNAANGSAFELARLHRDLGALIGNEAERFLAEHGSAELIASHGHTIFHQPGSGFTMQIGCGAQIAAITGLPTVVDFRTKDMALGGQGAPLVPFGERELFPGFDAFLNLGGIANVSFHSGKSVAGYDVCTCNQALNALANESGKDHDADGRLAAGGSMNAALLTSLNAMPFVHREVPRSLGRELFESDMLPLLQDPAIPLADRMRTCVEHVAQQIATHLDQRKAQRVLVTGGGAHNGFLMERIRALTSTEVVVPEHRIIDFKEALIFAFLGLKRYIGETNALGSVTGASRDSIGGAVYLPN
ncbi:MAG: anhydro-N-acetylmuramic acid kinase [Flavobacteriales bacterium]